MYVLAIANAFAQGRFSLCGQHISCREELCVPPAATGCPGCSPTWRSQEIGKYTRLSSDEGEEGQDGWADDDVPALSLLVV